MGPEIQGACYSGEKRPLPGMRRDSSEWVFTKIHGFPGIVSISRFGSKDLSNPKDDKTKDDAMIGVYPSECPKPILPLTKIRKLRGLVRNPKSEKAWKSRK